MTDTLARWSCIICFSTTYMDDGSPQHLANCPYAQGNAFGMWPGYLNQQTITTSMGIVIIQECSLCYAWVRDANWSMHATHHQRWHQIASEMQARYETADAAVVGEAEEVDSFVVIVESLDEFTDPPDGYAVVESAHSFCTGSPHYSKCRHNNDHDPHEFFWRRYERIES